MSHSTTLVVIRGAGSAAEAEEMLDDLLEPFNENLEVEEYVDWLTEEGVQSAINFYKDNPQFCTGEGGDGPLVPYDFEDAESSRLVAAKHQWIEHAVGSYCGSSRDRGTSRLKEDGSWEFGYTTNFNQRARWDWWALGGRWHGFFQLKEKVSIGSQPIPEWRKSVGSAFEDRKEGAAEIPVQDGTEQAILGLSGVGGDDPSDNFEGKADLALKGDIDFEAMRTLQAHIAEQEYDKYEEATKGIEIGRSFEVVRDEIAAGRELTQDVMDEARKAYWSQPWIKALQEAKLIGFFSNPVEIWSKSREEYVQRARDSAISTFAVLLDGEWYERGQMGWWGITSNEMDEGEWFAKQSALIEDLPDDVYLALVDVHV